MTGGIHAQRFNGGGDHCEKEEAEEAPEGEAGSEWDVGGTGSCSSATRALRLDEGSQPICGNREL